MPCCNRHENVPLPCKNGQNRISEAYRGIVGKRVTWNGKNIKKVESGITIDWCGLDEFRKSLPIDGELNFQNEYYRFLTLGWDIVKVQYLLSKIPHTVGQIDVASFMNVMGLPKDASGKHGMSLFYIDEKRVMGEKIDLSKPVILAHLIEGEADGNIMIDGLHRLVKAYRTGGEKLPAYLLTHEEELACRL